MPTTLQIDLSGQMQTWLSQGGAGNGVSVYAILYAGSDTPVAWQTLVSNGTVSNGGSFTLDLTTAAQPTLDGGKVYFIIQSTGNPANAINPATLAQSAITWGNAAALDYRYDSIEVSLTGQPGDAANLTGIEGFGIGMTLEATTGSRSYASSATQFFGHLADAATDPVAGKPAVATFTSGGLAGQDREAVSPAVAVIPANQYPLYAASDWNTYIAALKTSATPIVINGYFNGAADLLSGAPAGTPAIWRNAGFFSYQLEWSAAGNTFWLTPTEGSQIQGAIKLGAAALANSIYSTLGTVQLYDSTTATTPYQLYPGSSQMNTGANNAWGQVLQQLTLGLTAGYLESGGISPNPAVTTPVDLNKNYNWTPIYAFGTDTHSTLGSAVAQRWDPYAELFAKYTNSYGTQYADALMNAYAQGGPQLPTFANGQNVSTLNLTLYADGETPPAGAYTPPVIHDYVAGTGPGGQYAIPEWHAGNPANVSLDFNPGSSLAQSLVLSSDVQLSIRILTGYSGNTPQWQTLALGGNGVTPWQNWTFGYANGAYTVTGNGGAGQTSQSLVLTGMPMADSGVAWYQIVVADGGFQKVFNLYTTTFTPAGGAIPQFSDFGTDPSLFGIDGLATLTAGATEPGGGLLTFSIDVTGVSPTIDLSLLTANISKAFLNNQTIATAPVAGTVHGGTFQAVAGQTAEVHDGGGNGVHLSVTAQSGLLAFGWTGLNSAPDTRIWTETFTNLVQGHAIAVVDIASEGGGSIAPLHATADLAGGWHTAAVAQQLGNGVYDVTMTAYAAKAGAPGTPDYTTPLTRESATLTVTVQLADLGLTALADGSGLKLEAGNGGTTGNWIHFSGIAGGLPEGVGVVLYATDAEGHLVSADGQRVSSIAEAALGRVGAVGSDDGMTLLQGTQSVHLAVGQQLHFALAEDGGGISGLRPAGITDRGDGVLRVDLQGITLQAEIDNTLSANEQIAAVQRMYHLPLIHLDRGDRVEVALTGSADNTNTLGFVRFDLHPATGAISVGGVAYGDTDAFRDAVRHALDGGYGTAVGGGDFTDLTTWRVAGEKGYYAPVLLTQSGELFVPGDANPGGHDYIRTYGANTFGFEDLTAAQGADFDYNDLVMSLRPVPHTDLV